MQHSILNIAKDLEGFELVDSHLSFKGFIDFLKDRKLHEKTMKVKYLDFLINHFEHRLRGNYRIEVEQATQYQDLLELMYSTIFPAIEDESLNLWSLSIPLQPIIFYGTDPFYDLLWDRDSGHLRVCMIDEESKVRKKINVYLVYGLILKKLYNHTFFHSSSLIRSWKNEASGILNYYRLNIDTRFVEVFPKGPLPEWDPAILQSHLPGNKILDLLMKRLPLTLFRFEGISAITVTDITREHVVETIKNIILHPMAGCGEDSHYKDVIGALKSLSGSSAVDYGLLPFLKVNGRPVFPDDGCTHSLLVSAARENGDVEKTYVEMAEKYMQTPELVFFDNVAEAIKEVPFLSVLRQNGVKAYALVPVFSNNRVVGALEVSTKEEGILDQELLSRMDIVLPLLAQLLIQNIDDFEARIKAVVKENFTSMQPSVEWKFNEAAWHFLREEDNGDHRPVIETIYFKNVYPLYGAVDIRNSTIERNEALRKDLQAQFDILVSTLYSLLKVTNLELVDELIFQCRKWQDAILGSLTTAEEMDLNSFMQEKVDGFFTHFKETRPDTAEIIQPYLQAIDESAGIAFKHRRELEASIQLINKTINRQLESGKDEVQSTYPSYFEKFRTDGVEYDIYIGQTIAPDKPFDLIYLKNLRLWQLSSMAAIAQLTHALLPQMPGKLLTTQLIFVHSNSIDISFRKDERRFDVEGGYNIRYQVVKKRIDKVHIKNSNERLTQPGKIAVIYFNDKEAEEYLGYVKYLQEKDILNDDLEQVELEELQGVSGLKAFRVGVKLG
ncbi:MAG TPA: GAF domain-containing protein [Puia sp.]|nr:GAF domain-containing protein [Puia sp.]